MLFLPFHFRFRACAPSDNREYIEKMTIDESKEMTPYWGVTTDNYTKVVCSDHCMIELVMSWRMMLIEESGKKKYMGQRICEICETKKKISDILKKGDFQHGAVLYDCR